MKEGVSIMETQLYPGIAFSPPAALTDNIGAGDTIIPVSDAGSFPPAPNLATIGADEDGETILYAAKTATALSGCVRGVEGTARAWSAGEPIARNWTAKDHADLIAAVREARAAAEEARAASDPAGTAAATVEAHDGDAKAHGERFAAKQDALRGRPGEAVGFGENGVAQAVPGWSNPNLLDNYYFADPVNQRGQTEYTAAGYTIDRWRMAIDIGKILVEDDGLVVDATSNAVTFYQPFDGKLRWILGKTFTVTIEYTYLSGPVWSELMFNLNGTLNALHTGNLAAETGKRMVRSVTAVIPGSVTGSAAPLSLAWFYAAKGAKVKIHSIKCELGARQTLLHQDADGHWVLNAPPPNKALELAKCQRYFERSAWNATLAVAINNSELRFCGSYYFKAVKRVAPAITVEAAHKGQQIEPFDTVDCVYITGLQAIEPIAYNQYMFSPRVSDPQSKLVPGRVYQVIIPDNLYNISADL